LRWQLQEAKQRFSEVVRQALDEGPQIVTRRGEDSVVVISIQEYRRLTGEAPNFMEFLMSFPDAPDLELERFNDLPREVDL